MKALTTLSVKVAFVFAFSAV